ncbi:MAG: hypothetical protein WC729_03990 [Sphingomonas sp.]|jgi:hypothetical protein|uniref:hypothetical protein n=1 Tax=Sphingomonas sp. TaxID=28214 RepID=UPI003565818B
MRYRDMDDVIALVDAGIPITTNVQYRDVSDIVRLAEAAALRKVPVTLTGLRYMDVGELMTIGRAGSGFATLVDEVREKTAG